MPGFSCKGCWRGNACLFYLFFESALSKAKAFTWGRAAGECFPCLLEGASCFAWGKLSCGAPTVPSTALRATFLGSILLPGKEREGFCPFFCVSCCSVAPHGPQQARLPCPSLCPEVCSSSCPFESVMPVNHIILCVSLSYMGWGWGGTSLVVPWLWVHLPMQGIQVLPLAWEDSTCLGATKRMLHNYRAHAPEPGSCSYWALMPRLLKDALWSL